MDEAECGTGNKQRQKAQGTLGMAGCCGCALRACIRVSDTIPLTTCL